MAAILPLSHEAAAALLERYFEATTTVAEERQLAHYFAGRDVAPALQQYAPLFGYWAELRRPPLAAPTRRRTPRRQWMAVAAGFLLLLTAAWFGLRPLPTPTQFPLAVNETPPPPVAVDWSRYEVTDPEEAVRVLHGALRTTSRQLSRGPKMTVHGLREFTDAIR